MPTYLYYTQGILDFQEETATYSESFFVFNLPVFQQVFNIAGQRPGQMSAVGRYT